MSPINELGRDLDPRYILTEYIRDLRRITPRRAATVLADQNNQLAH